MAIQHSTNFTDAQNICVESVDSSDTSSNSNEADTQIKRNTYLIFPFISTNSPITINGITLKSSNDHVNESEIDKEHLSNLFSLFYLSDNFQIRRLTYAIVPISDNESETSAVGQEIKSIQLLFSYVYGNSRRDNRGISQYDQVTFYWASPQTLGIEYLWPTAHQAASVVDKHSQNDEQFPFNSHLLTQGYDLVTNGTGKKCAAKGSRIYPSGNGLTFSAHRDLGADLKRFIDTPSNWAIAKFFGPDFSRIGQFGRRILTSLEWFSLSMSEKLTDEEVLLYMAVSLESLLGLSEGEKVTERFKESILLLIGPVANLEQWSHQFYKARSAIVHDGTWSHIHFDASFSHKKSNTSQRDEPPDRLGLLSDYARRIYCLCFEVILSGHMLADSDNLSGALTSNKQRLIEMRKLLDCLPEDSARNRNRIHILVIDIFHFSASGYQKANEMELYSALIHLVQETIPLISNENSSVKSSLERILNIGQNASNRDRVMTIIEIKKELQWDTRIFGGPSPSRTDQLTKLNKDPTLCIRMFIEIILMGNLRRY